MIATLLFGPDPDGTHRRMLESWLASLRAAGIAATPVVLSDASAPAAPEVRQIRLLSSVLRPLSSALCPPPAHPFDLKGLLLCAAAQQLGPFLYTDLDTRFLRDPAPFLASLPATTVLGLPINLGSIRDPLFDCPTRPELHVVLKRCAGVIWFGDARPAVRAALALAYHAAFTEIAAALLAGELHEPRHLLEQWAWSLVWHRLAQTGAGRAAHLPDTFNFPAGVRPPQADTFIEHWCGPQKLQRLWGERDPRPGVLVPA
jgi:hypothetical protein